MIEFTDVNFDEEVLKSDTPVLVDFWAPWCGPCRVMSPLIEELAEEYEGKVKIGKINVDDHPNKVADYKPSSIPTLLFFKDGKMVVQLAGIQTKATLKHILDSL